MGLMLKKPDDVAGSPVPALLVGLFISFGGVLFGYDTGTIGGILAMPYWRNLFSTGYINEKDHMRDITADQKSEIVSILSAGTFFGALLSAPVADNLGRRWGMIFNTGVFTLGVILQCAATAIPMVSSVKNVQWLVAKGSTVRCRSLLCRSWCWSPVSYNSLVPVGDGSKVD